MPKRKKKDGRGRKWPEVQIGFMVVGVKTRKPKAVAWDFANALNRLCRRYKLDGVQFKTVA